MNLDNFYEMDAMKYFDKSDDSKLSPALLKKKYDMINNNNREYIASEKWDGNWMMFIIDADNNIFCRSRSRNVKGIYEDYSPKIPHIVKELQNLNLVNCVFLGEVCWGQHGTVATDVGTILRCLAPKAVERQKDRKLVVKMFDCLMLNGVDLTAQGYEKRVEIVKEHIPYGNYCGPTTWYEEVDTFAPIADAIIEDGGEGLVIQRKDYCYEPGKRTSWKTLKLKAKLPEAEYKVIGTLEPTKEFTGDTDLALWEYWEDDKPVTKNYYYRWKSGIIIDVDGVEVKVASGMTDDFRSWLSTDEAQEYIKQGRLIAVVKGMEMTADGSIRHPILKDLRTDLN